MENLVKQILETLKELIDKNYENNMAIAEKLNIILTSLDEINKSQKIK